MEFCDGGIGLSGSKADLDGRNSRAALGFANRFGLRRMTLKPPVALNSERRSGSCLRFLAIDCCRHEDENAVTTADKPKSSKSNERCMGQGASEKKGWVAGGATSKVRLAYFLRLYRGVSTGSKFRLAHGKHWLAPISVETPRVTKVSGKAPFSGVGICK